MDNLFYKAEVLPSAVKLATVTSSLFLSCAWKMCRNDPEMSIADEEFVCHSPLTEKPSVLKVLGFSLLFCDVFNSTYFFYVLETCTTESQLYTANVVFGGF